MKKTYEFECLKDSDNTHPSDIVAFLPGQNELTFEFQAPYRKITIKVCDLKEIIKEL